MNGKTRLRRHCGWNYYGHLMAFIAVKKLYLCKISAGRIVLALQELVGGRATEVLPSLHNIFLEEFQTSEPVQEGIQQFVTMRQASHPIVVSPWGGDS
jgi:hypothetical protein